MDPAAEPAGKIVPAPPIVDRGVGDVRPATASHLWEGLMQVRVGMVYHAVVDPHTRSPLVTFDFMVQFVQDCGMPLDDLRVVAGGDVYYVGDAVHSRPAYVMPVEWERPFRQWLETLLFMYTDEAGVAHERWIVRCAEFCFRDHKALVIVPHSTAREPTLSVRNGVPRVSYTEKPCSLESLLQIR